MRPCPWRRIPSRGLQYILLALAASLGLGVGLAFLIEYLDWTIKTPEELDAVYGMSTLGVIGMVKNGSRNRTGQEGLVTLTAPHSPIAEAFRALRTNLQFASPGQAAAQPAGHQRRPGRGQDPDLGQPGRQPWPRTASGSSWSIPTCAGRGCTSCST